MSTSECRTVASPGLDAGESFHLSDNSTLALDGVVVQGVSLGRNPDSGSFSAAFRKAE